MSDPPKNDAPGQGKSTAAGLAPWIAVGVLSAGLGSAVPFLLAGPTNKPSDEDADHASEEAGGGNSGAAANAAGANGTSTKKPKKVKAFTLPKEEETVFLPFADAGKDPGIVVNLDEGRMSRYLRVAITMQIPKAAEEDFKKRVDTKRILLRNWLLSKISDLDLEDIRGAAGQNRLRREIRDHFNSVLCPDGYDQIYDVLFEEFNVQ